MISSRSFHLLLTRGEDGLWLAQWIDGDGHLLKDSPAFYSRYSMWAQAHALTWYADQLYKIQYTTTPLD